MRTILFAAFAAGFQALPAPVRSQDQVNMPEVVVVSTQLEEALEKLPSEPEDVMCGMSRVKKFRREVIKARSQVLLLLETKRMEYCGRLKGFDAETENLAREKIIGSAVYDLRKDGYASQFDLNCNESRKRKKPPEGLLDLYTLVSEQISILEEQSENMVNDCFGDGRCSTNSCQNG